MFPGTPPQYIFSEHKTLYLGLYHSTPPPPPPPLPTHLTSLPVTDISRGNLYKSFNLYIKNGNTSLSRVIFQIIYFAMREESHFQEQSHFMYPVTNHPAPQPFNYKKTTRPRLSFYMLEFNIL